MVSPNLLDVMRISGDSKMKKKVIKAAKADKKVEELTKKDEKKTRSASEIRGLYRDWEIGRAHV